MKILINLICMLFATTVFAGGNHYTPPQSPPPGTPTQFSSPAPASSPEEDRSKNMLAGGAVAGGLAITALQKTDRPWLYTVAAGTVVALAGKQAGDWSGKETRSFAGGVILGATGVGLVFGKNFFGWQTAIKF